MKSLLIVLVLLVAGVVGLGFYRGWFSLSTEKAGQKTDITVTVDQDKVKEDEEKVKEKLKDVAEKVKDKTAASTDQAKE